MKHKFYFILLFLISFLGVKALFHSGFYTSHDGRHQIIRLMHFHQGFVDGQMPVRWAGTALKGYGYPLFVFTYRLPFWLAEIGYLVFKNLASAIKFAFILTYIASGITMYYFAKELWKSRLAGFLTAVLYLWAPYRFVDIFVRASLGEATTFMFLPLVFLGILKMAQNNKNYFKWLIFTSLSLAGLILSHAIILSLWLIPLLFWFILNFIQIRNKKQKINFFTSSFLASILSLFLTAYYWLPAMAERKYVKFSSSIGNYYQAHFVALKQLLYSKWGYGFSMPGVKDDMMSFQVGISQWLVVVSTVIMLIFGLLIFYFKNNKIKHFCQRYINLKNNDFKMLFYFLLIFGFSIYLMISSSAWFYRLVGKFFTIDIPWRFLTLAVFASSVLFGGLTVIIKNQFYKKGFIILVLFLAFYGNRHHLKVNKYIYLPDSEYWQSAETSNEYDDYAPRWFSGNNLDQRDSQLITSSGRSKNKLLKRKSNFFRFYSEVKSKKAEIITKIAYYPGWQIFIDGQKKKLEQKDGRIRVNLGQGNHLISLIFRETKLRRFSNWLSLLTLISLIGFLIKYGKQKK